MKIQTTAYRQKFETKRNYIDRSTKTHLSCVPRTGNQCLATSYSFPLKRTHFSQFTVHLDNCHAEGSENSTLSEMLRDSHRHKRNISNALSMGTGGSMSCVHKLFSSPARTVRDYPLTLLRPLAEFLPMKLIGTLYRSSPTSWNISFSVFLIS